MKYLIPNLLLSCYLSFFSFSHAQHLPFKTHYLNNWDGEGIYDATNFVAAILQDRRGFVWLATNGGLIRYDGSEEILYTYEPGSPLNLGTKAISVLLEDSKGNIWMGHDVGIGLIKFSPETETFEVYDNESVLIEDKNFNRIVALAEDKKGHIWIGTRIAGLYCFDPSRDTILTVFREQKQNINAILTDDIKDLVIDADGDLWIGSAFGLSRLAVDKKQFSHFTTKEGLSDSYITALYLDAQQTLWVGTLKGGINRLDKNTTTFVSYLHDHLDSFSLSANHITAFGEDAKGHLLVGTNGGGLNQLDKQQQRFYRYFPKLNNSTNPYGNYNINDICTDQSGSVWVATYKGVEVAKNLIQPFHFIPKNGEVNFFYPYDDENMWVCGDQFLLYNYETGHLRNVADLYPDFNQLAGAIVRNIYKDSLGSFWFNIQGTRGVLGNMTVQFFPETGQTKTWLDSSLPNHSYIATATVQDDENTYWFSTFSGLVHFNTATQESKIYAYQVDNSNSPSSNALLRIFKDSEGLLWLGTQGEGWNRFDPKTEAFTRFQYQPGLKDSPTLKTVYTFYEDQKGNIWVGGEGGLNHYDKSTGQVSSFLKKDGLANNIVNKICGDQKGNLWMSTNHGLSKFNPKTQRFKNYYQADGLPYNNFSWGVGTTDARGYLYFGQAGFVLFHPDSVLENPYVPKVFFKEFQLFNQRLSVGDEHEILQKAPAYTTAMELEHDQNVLSIIYTAPTFFHPEHTSFAYQMEGFDEDWQWVGSKREATYTNLPAGQYYFKVKAANNDGLWNEQASVLSVKVWPPWWQSWWAYGLYAITLGFVWYQIYRFQLNKKLEQAENQRLRELDKIKTQLYTNITHEFRTPLSLILGMVEQIKENPQDWYNEGLQMIKRNGQLLLNLISRILDLNKLQAGSLPLHYIQADIISYLQYITESFQSYAISKNIQLTFHTEIEELVMDYEPEQLLIVLSNLLSNAIKFTPENGNIVLHLKQLSTPYTTSHLQIKVKDSGIGIPKEEIGKIFNRFYQIKNSKNFQNWGTGIGLAFSKEVVELMGGQIKVESVLQKGSNFIVLLPVKQDAIKVDTPNKQMLKDTIENLVYGATSAEYANHDAIVSEREDAPVLLIIEDNWDITQYLIACLEKNYNIITAMDGQQGIEQAIKTIPNLIISDVMMPEKDGYEVCHILKKDERTSHIPFILLTAKATKADKLMGLKMGADAYLSKPFNKEELLLILHNMQEMQKKLQQHYVHQHHLKPFNTTNETSYPIEDAFLLKVTNIILQHLDDLDFNVPTLCRIVGMSHSQLHRKLKALCGISANKLILQLKMEKAKTFLLSTELNITQIAFETGFSDVSYFGKVFHKYTGESPSGFRKMRS